MDLYPSRVSYQQVKALVERRIESGTGRCQSRDPCEAAWWKLLDSREIREQGKGLLIVHDEDRARS